MTYTNSNEENEGRKWKKKIDLESVVYLDIFACLVCHSLIFPVDMF